MVTKRFLTNCVIRFSIDGKPAAINGLRKFWLKQYPAKRKMISENIATDKVKGNCRNFNSLNFQQLSIFMNDNIEYVQVLILQTRLCQLQINSPVMAS